MYGLKILDDLIVLQQLQICRRYVFRPEFAQNKLRYLDHGFGFIQIIRHLFSYTSIIYIQVKNWPIIIISLLIGHFQDNKFDHKCLLPADYVK